MYSAIFQAGSLLVLIAESRTRAYLASIVPVIVNTVLNEHQLVLDIVAFVQKGDFPRSRLGEKQRGKILATWVSRKMRTIAQFSIRDPDAEGSVGTAVPDDMMAHRASLQSGRANTGNFARSGPGSLNRMPGTAGSSLRNVESISQMPLMEEPQSSASGEGGLTLQVANPYADEPLEAPRHVFEGSHHPDDRDARSDDTPTNERPRPLQLNTTLDYSPIDKTRMFYESPNVSMPQLDQEHQQHQHQQHQQYQQDAPRYDSTYLTYEPVSPIELSMGEPARGGLRVANRTSSGSDDDWP